MKQLSFAPAWGPCITSDLHLTAGAWNDLMAKSKTQVSIRFWIWWRKPSCLFMGTTLLPDIQQNPAWLKKFSNIPNFTFLLFWLLISDKYLLITLSDQIVPKKDTIFVSFPHGKAMSALLNFALWTVIWDWAHIIHTSLKSAQSPWWELFCIQS